MPDILGASNSIKLISFCGGDIERFSPSEREYWARIIDDLGAKSAKAQKLSRPITIFDKLARIAQHHRVYVAMQLAGGQFKPIGLLKIGEKRIFHLNKDNKDSKDIEHFACLCVLDFYVSDENRGHGYGRFMMDTMIATEPKINSAQDLAIDRPSQQCLSFFEKCYNLKPTRVGIDGNFCIFSNAVRSQYTNFASSAYIEKDSKATSVYYEKN